jgi:hypothetical protein
MFLLVNLLSLISKGNNPSLQKLYSCHHDLVNRYGISVSQNDHGYVPLVIKHFPVLSSFMTYHRFVTSLTRRVPLVEQKLFTLPEHLSSSPVFSRVRVTRSLVLYVCLIYRSLFVLLYFFFWPLFLSSSICGFWLLPLVYLQTLLNKNYCMYGIFLWRFCQCSQKCLWNTIEFHLSLNRSNRNELSVVWFQASLWFLLQKLPIYVMFFTGTRLRETICRGLHTH